MSQNHPILKTSGAVLAGTLLLSGCGHPTAGNLMASTPMTASATTTGKAVLMLTPQVDDGHYKAQAIVNNYKRSDINHVTIALFTVDASGSETPVMDQTGHNTLTVDVLQSELDNPVSFSNLFVNTTYRVRCFAFKSAGMDHTSQISDDSASYVDIPVAYDDRPTLGKLKVKLVDVPFDGEATASGVVVTDGRIVPNGPVKIGKGSH